MQAPNWLGECGSYLGQTEHMQNSNGGERVVNGGGGGGGGGGGYIPPPPPPPDTLPPPPTEPYPPPELPPEEPVTNGVTSFPPEELPGGGIVCAQGYWLTSDGECVPVPVEEEVPPVVVDENGEEVVEYTDPETGITYMIPVGAGGGGRPGTVTKGVLPKWVVPVLIAGATMLLGSKS